MRIAILHYTAPPCIGGIESLIEAQLKALSTFGYGTCLIVGQGDSPPGGGVVRLPELDPAAPVVREAAADLRGRLPPVDHPLVVTIAEQVRRALETCTQCWVHNAFTVYLNPFLTVALMKLAREFQEVRWVAWCSDLSQRSLYEPQLSPAERDRLRLPDTQLAYVTISQTRRAELAETHDIHEHDIAVITPPLDVYDWLDINPETVALSRALGLEEAEPVLLVPAKLLPHKNLELVVRVTAQLRTLIRRPLLLITGAPSPHEPRRSQDLAAGVQELVRRQHLEEHVSLITAVLGKVADRRTIRDLMLLCDLVVVPSTEEGFGVPLREAAALRVPTLCSDIPAFHEAGRGFAHYFSLEATPRQIARQVLEITASKPNQARRGAVQSFHHFQADLWDLIGVWNGSESET